eukprot:CAMPEP_0119084106 /NCGR_PEP_ID=MMETSP1178-20130426/128367_1 /TAXON_ID=33656 /ORGANISM="unid sp, Strain CCMP2000" /LENGTH=140 /DNA_ID=CAMNT_0007067041 /DNA_START=33 /DNA_END=452 /DNA_ORIENTATION=-
MAMCVAIFSAVRPPRLHEGQAYAPTSCSIVQMLFMARVTSFIESVTIRAPAAKQSRRTRTSFAALRLSTIGKDACVTAQAATRRRSAANTGQHESSSVLPRERTAMLISSSAAIAASASAAVCVMMVWQPADAAADAIVA